VDAQRGDKPVLCCRILLGGYFTARIVLTVKYSPVKLRRLTSLPPAYGFLPRGADTAIQDGL
jgi:hypothetical protein